MMHSSDTPLVSAAPDADTAGTGSPALTRRHFIKFAAAGAGSIALQACGGGGGGNATTSGVTPTTPPPTTPPTTTNPPTTNPPTGAGSTPVWSAIPTLTFTLGVAGSMPIGQYVSGNVAAIRLNEIELPEGVIYNDLTRSFDYDGVGGLASVDGFVLTATGA
ncbi:hypothetical protein [Massilia sp. erpn]|uniref:hypothetical protein n=1 Tax=Massilia sp. erpn TaxID=2738142 RepID=UPI0021080439|nr:hypothetical protein [Massilia sp. erpn]UTY55700.1 hypothetical protein HPQ68_06520 [Massilia sp. erpn]